MRDEYDFSKLKKRPGKPKVIPDAGKIPISLRIEGTTLGKLQVEALRLGIPYQTLIGSVLHRYVTDELIDRKDIASIKNAVEKKK